MSLNVKRQNLTIKTGLTNALPHSKAIDIESTKDSIITRLSEKTETARARLANLKILEKQLVAELNLEKPSLNDKAISKIKLDNLKSEKTEIYIKNIATIVFGVLLTILIIGWFLVMEVDLVESYNKISDLNSKIDALNVRLNKLDMLTDAASEKSKIERRIPRWERRIQEVENLQLPHKFNDRVQHNFAYIANDQVFDSRGDYLGLVKYDRQI